MSRGQAKIVFADGDYRVVLIGTEKYIIERKDGVDSLGVERWRTEETCSWWASHTSEENADLGVPRELFRGLMRVICRIVDADERATAVGQ